MRLARPYVQLREPAWWVLAAFLAVLAAALLSGCKQCDYESRGGCFKNDDPALAFSPEAIEKGLALADAHYGTSIDLKHYEVYFVESTRVRCGDGDAIGCTCYEWCSWVKIAHDPSYPCGVGYVFVHELGHVVYPGMSHDDPLFSFTYTELAAMAKVCMEVLNPEVRDALHP